MNNHELLLQINLLFGFLYLPWQFFHLKNLHLRSNNQEVIANFHSPISKLEIMKGLHKSIKLKIPSIESRDWGGVIGMTWMVSYWATIIPGWLYLIIQTIH